MSQISKIRLFIERIIFFIVILGVWELLSIATDVPDYVISRPTSILSWMIEALPTAFLWHNILVTLRETFLGLVIGSIAGILAAFVLAWWDRLYQITEPLIMALYSLPRVALAPLFLVWFGIGEASKVALAVSLVFFVLLLNTHTGIKSVDKDLVNAVRTMGANSFFIARRVMLPASMPFIFTGLRISIGLALIGTIVGEMLAAQYGLGQMIARAANTYRTDQIFGIIVILGAMAIVGNSLMSILERRLLRWLPDRGKS